ncbi:hypothetical protein BJX68DRAFT_246411 [Aspergillus pseudodeflectus]|uniref:Uncharacterized protein n=1 Tax=Aspergillus pseudodeflectus TaxID=176178 RepID=A0ABR4JL26_9EURO
MRCVAACLGPAMMSPPQQISSSNLAPTFQRAAFSDLNQELCSMDLLILQFTFARPANRFSCSVLDDVVQPCMWVDAIPLHRSGPGPTIF